MSRRRISRREVEEKRLLDNRVVEDQRRSTTRKVKDDYFYKDILKKENARYNHKGSANMGLDRESNENEIDNYSESREQLKKMLQEEEEAYSSALKREKLVEREEQTEFEEVESGPGTSSDSIQIQVKRGLENDEEISYLRTRLALHELNRDRETQIEQKRAERERAERENGFLESEYIQESLKKLEITSQEEEERKKRLIEQKSELERQIEEKRKLREKAKINTQSEALEIERLTQQYQEEMKKERMQKTKLKKELLRDGMQQISDAQDAEERRRREEKKGLEMDIRFSMDKDESEKALITKYKEEQEMRNQLIDKIAREIEEERRRGEESITREINVALAKELRKQAEKEKQDRQRRESMERTIRDTNVDLISAKLEVLQNEADLKETYERIEQEESRKQLENDREAVEKRRKEAVANRTQLEEAIKMKMRFRGEDPGDTQEHGVYKEEFERTRVQEKERLIQQLLGDKQQIDVFNVSTQEKIFTHMSQERVTSFTLGTFAIQPERPQRKSRKKARTHAPASIPVPLLLLGLNSGTAVLFDMNTQQVRTEMKSVHTAAITSLDINESLNRVACASEADGMVSIWNENGACEKQLNFKKVSSLKWSPKGDYLAVGRAKILVVDPFSDKHDDKKAICTFVGHARSCRGLLWDKKGEHVVSFADDDRAVCIWEVQEQKKAAAALRSSIVIMCSEFPLRISLNDEMQLLVHTQNSVFFKRGTDEDKEIQTGFSTRIYSSNKNYRIVGSAFLDPGYSDVLVAVAAPTGTVLFKKIATGGDEADVDVCQDLVDPQKAAVDKTKAAQAIDAVGQVNVPLKVRERDGTREDGPEKSFKEMLQITEKKMKPEGTTGSLISILRQALQSGDEVLLETVLRAQKHQLVYSTVSKLLPSEVFPFLGQITKAYDKNPKSIERLIPWITATFHIFNSYIVSNPSSIEILSPLYRSIEERLRNYDKLSRLNGRIDMLIGQAKAAEMIGTDSQFHKVDTSTEVVYVDSDEEEENGGEDEEEEEGDDVDEMHLD